MLKRLFPVLLALSLQLHGARGQTPASPPGAPPAAQSSAAAIPGQACDTPNELTDSDERLSSVAQALKAGDELNVLAIGSATMLGPRGETETSFPFRMTSILHAAVPGARIRLTLHSGRGLTAADMLVNLRTELAAHSYQLVLWQTATVEAVRNLPPEELFQTLSTGADQVRQANGDLILIDPQYSRFLRANANLDPYLQAMQQASALPDVALFHRFDLMKHWVDTSQIDLERTARGQRTAMATLLNDCIGRALATFILRGAGISSP